MSQGPTKRKITTSRKGIKTPRPGPSLKQHKFIENIAKDLPVKLAAEDAGYSEDTAVQQGMNLIKKPHIRAAIEARKQRAAFYANITPEMIMGATAMRAFCSIDDAFDEEGNFDIQLARQTGAIHLVKKYEKRNGVIKVEFYDNAQAQDKLGNYLGMEVAPAENKDAASLKAGIESVAQAIAGAGKKVKPEHRLEAFQKVKEWAMDSKVRYSNEAIQEVAKEYVN